MADCGRLFRRVYVQRRCGLRCLAQDDFRFLAGVTSVESGRNDQYVLRLSERASVRVNGLAIYDAFSRGVNSGSKLANLVRRYSKGGVDLFCYLRDVRFVN